MPHFHVELFYIKAIISFHFQKMLVFDPLRRISAKDAMNHNFFKDSEVQTSKYKAKKLKKSSVSVGSEPGISSATLTKKWPMSKLGTNL